MVLDLQGRLNLITSDNGFGLGRNARDSNRHGMLAGVCMKAGNAQGHGHALVRNPWR